VFFCVEGIPKPHLRAGIRKAQIFDAAPESVVGGEVLDSAFPYRSSQISGKVHKEIFGCGALAADSLVCYQPSGLFSLLFCLEISHLVATFVLV
jgi:hypothetical protein